MYPLHAKLSRTIVLVALVSLLIPEGVAAERAVRELTTDRPDATESPFTVEPGHVQLEMDFANYSHDRQSGIRTVVTEAVPFNLRFGLAPDLEAGVFIVPLHRETVTAGAGPKIRQSGFGDLTLRTKLNLWGNDGGKTAFGAIADLKLPCASGGLGNGKFEGALLFPLAFSLAGGWDAGAMTSVALVYNGTSHQAVWDNTFTVGHDLSEDVGTYFELTSSAGDGSHVATFNCGLTRSFGRDTQLDGGISVGISASAPDVQFFAGVSRRW
jgi:hypothetical protein